MKQRIARKFYYYLLDGQRYKNTVDISCLENAKFSDVCKHYEEHLEKVQFIEIDDDGKEHVEPREYYIGEVYRSLDELRCVNKEMYDKIMKDRCWQHDAENDDTFVVTETGKLYTICEPDKPVDINHLARKSERKL